MSRDEYTAVEWANSKMDLRARWNGEIYCELWKALKWERKRARERQDDGPAQYKQDWEYLPATGRSGQAGGSSNTDFEKSQLRYRVADHLLSRHHRKYLESHRSHEKKYARHCLCLHERWDHLSVYHYSFLVF